MVRNEIVFLATNTRITVSFDIELTLECMNLSVQLDIFIYYLVSFQVYELIECAVVYLTQKEKKRDSQVIEKNFCFSLSYMYIFLLLSALAFFGILFFKGHQEHYEEKRRERDQI